jgi:hypothetical protein
VTDRLRAEAMSRRLTRTATRLGVDAAGLDVMRRAFELAMAPRFRDGLEDHHPDYLHTARTALILMDDARIADPCVLAAALVTETRDESLMLDAAALVELGPAAALAESVPQPRLAGEGIAEGLVVAAREARLIAVAERLDHARHLHLRGREEWPAYHALTRRVYVPVAERTHPALAGRITWWCTTFETRFLTPGRDAGVARL